MSIPYESYRVGRFNLEIEVNIPYNKITDIPYTYKKKHISVIPEEANIESQEIPKLCIRKAVYNGDIYRKRYND